MPVNKHYTCMTGDARNMISMETKEKTNLRYQNLISISCCQPSRGCPICMHTSPPKRNHFYNHV